MLSNTSLFSLPLPFDWCNKVMPRLLFDINADISLQATTHWHTGWVDLWGEVHRGGNDMMAGVRAEWEEKLERMTVKINFGIKEWEERDKRWNGISGKDTKVHVKTDQAWCRLEKQEIRQLTSLGLLSYLHPSQLSLLNRYVSEKEAYGEKQTNRRVQEKISVWRRSITYRDKSTRRRKKGCSVCP